MLGGIGMPRYVVKTKGQHAPINKSKGFMPSEPINKLKKKKLYLYCTNMGSNQYRFMFLSTNHLGVDFFKTFEMKSIS